ncbi:thiamine pyrophosphate-dependent dehydrogenase E1 component subunit alpha [candidate division KSB1 bacterium]
MFSKELWTDIYRKLYAIRVFETSCVKLYRQGLIIGYFHPYTGEEAIAVGACSALREDDYIVSTHRGHGHCIAKDGKIDRMIAEVLGRESGYCRGLGGSMHIADIEKGNIGANGIVGGGIPIGVGAGLGISIRGTDQAVVIFFSDGASNNGVFAESLNLAAIWNLPVVFMLENNHYAVSTPVEDSSRTNDLYKRAEGYGVSSFPVDGNDVKAVYEKTQEALSLCRNGEGPVLIEAKTYRFGGHHVNDPGQYMPKDRLEFYKSKDPVNIGREYLTNEGELSEEEIINIETEIENEIKEAIRYAKECPELSVETFMEELVCQ